MTQHATKLERAIKALKEAIALADAYASGTGTIYEEGMARVRQTLRDIEND